MTPPILVTGGTGALGRQVVQRLVAAGQPVRVASRRPHGGGPYDWAVVDYKTGAGLENACRDVRTIVHCAYAATNTSVEETLIAAARQAGNPHIVYISIVGIDDIPLFSYKPKLAAERRLADSGLPWTVLRATQFHDLIFRGCELLGRSPIVPILPIRVQSIDSGEVADRLVELAAGPPAGRVPDIGGPQVRDITDLMKTYFKAKGKRRLLLPLWVPGKTFRAYRDGHNLTPENAYGKITFEQALEKL